ncbi:DUF1289 domain-containing protein [Sphingomonas palmae]|uniref:DUF1289 domain-containing protein n=1 Tax=Sphingomonas palmae TaxID=1855283 RepID=UPI002481C7D5|nr:DUF1289 domain-containing protein [Sphingomonas palmae]
MADHDRAARAWRGHAGRRQTRHRRYGRRQPLTDAPPSPCILVCTMDRVSGLCLGCYRTITEITGWSRADDDEKRAILARVTKRRAAP